MKADQSIINNGCVRWIKSLERDQEIAEKDCMLHMYKIRGGDETETFSATEIRNSFLRFFVSILLNYAKYLDTDSGTFDAGRFVSSLKYGTDNLAKEFVASMLDKQIFSHFIGMSVTNSTDSEVMFFNESIIAKKNRKKNHLKCGKHTSTPFLSDTSGKITETYQPTPPSSPTHDGKINHFIILASQSSIRV